MLTSEEAVKLLAACKPLAEQLSALSTPAGDGTKSKYQFSPADLVILEGFYRVQNDPISAGPGLLNRLYKQAGLNQVETSQLEHIGRLIYKKLHP